MMVRNVCLMVCLAAGLLCARYLKIDTVILRDAQPSRRKPAAVVLQGLQLGDVISGVPVKHIITVHNSSSGRIFVRELSAGCGCVAVEPAQFHLEAGASRNVALTVEMMSDDDRDIRIQLRAHTDECEATSGFLSGRLLSRMKIPDQRRFFVVSARQRYEGQSNVIGSLTGTLDSSFAMSAPEITAEIGSLQSVTGVLDADDYLRIAVVARGSGVYCFELVTKSGAILSPGAYAGTLVVKGTLADSQLIEIARCRFQIIAEPVLSVIPPVVVFGPSGQDNQKSHLVVVHSETGTEFSLHHLSCSENLNVQPAGSRQGNLLLKVSRARSAAQVSGGVITFDCEFQSGYRESAQVRIVARGATHDKGVRND